MTVTHTFEEIGDWSITFDPSIPGNLLDLGDYPLLMVLPGRVPVDAAKQITRPMFRGVILSRDGLYGLSGADMTWYLGTPSEDLTQTDGQGPWFATLWTGASATDVMDYITTKNGLSYQLGAGVSGTITGGINGTPRTALDRVIAPQLQCDWRVRTDGTILLYKRSSAMAQRLAVLTHDPGGSDPGILSWHISDRDPRISNTDRRNREVIRWTDANGTAQTTSSPLATGPKAYGGADLEVCEFWSSNSTTSADINAQRDFLAAVRNLRTQALTVSTDTPMAVAQLPALDNLIGSGVGIFDPEIGMYDKTAAPLMFRGRQIWPATSRVTQVEWPIVEGMGVYIDSRWAGGDLVDVTDWVAWETGDTTLTLGQLPRWWDGKRRPI